MMRAYINGTAAISPQKTFDRDDYLSEWLKPDDSCRHVQAPDYKLFFDAKQARRMSRILKLSSTTAQLCMQQSSINRPEAVIVGTALGCLEDTEKFMGEIVINEEGLLAPTAFIQSTHNTLAAQIAIQNQCTAYNFTYVQRGHSFENALEDGIMHLHEGKDYILVGAVDEITPTLLKVLKSIDYLDAPDAGVWGEGAAFFLLSQKPSNNSKACIEGLQTYFDASPEQMQKNIVSFLHALSVQVSDIDAIVLGVDEQIEGDAYYIAVMENDLAAIPCFQYKHFCGEYFTASAFGHHLVTEVIHQQKTFPGMLIKGNLPTQYKKVLFYNHFKGKYHTLSLLSQC